MTTFHQTLEQMARSWLQRKLEKMVFGPRKQGEPAYDNEPTVHSTYPREWRPGNGTEEYNDWISGIHGKRNSSNRKNRFLDKG